ncbi:MAG TPA: signal recognition particle-docking protein FtsY [Candidatus Binataceae bacterium]|nr:signal recognition particle-docking protein FtsY [Candidatus Binataceae bacterium]
MADYLDKIISGLSSGLSAAADRLSSLEQLSLDRLARLSLIDKLALILLASQVLLFIVACLIEFSARKRRGFRAIEPVAAEELPEAPVEAPTSPPVAAEPPIHAPPPPSAPPLEAEPSRPAAELPDPGPKPAPAPAAPPAPAVSPSAAPTAGAPPTVPPPEPAAGSPTAPSATPAPPKAAPRIGLGLRRTRENLLARVRAAITGSAKLDEICEGLEEALVAADVGVQASLKLVEAVRARVGNGARPDAIREALKGEIARMLTAAERPLNAPASGPLVVMLAGVNGVGKTTTVAKLAARMKSERGNVIVAAADTFRAAAIEQLEVWCGRVGVDLIKQKQGSDPAAVAFDAVKAAIARDGSTVLIDTAGRLQTKVNLMEELKKIARVVGRELPGAPHECWLVLDATTGQNALSQAKIFGDSVPLTGVVLAKLDSTAKGGVVVAIAEQLKLPVRFVGVGENVEDLRAFDAREFVEALFSDDEERAETSSGSYAA